ncbi:MAG: hypothetical protein AB1746_09510 [Candidatus Zixiibacteriota bacterium]
MCNIRCRDSALLFVYIEDGQDSVLYLQKNVTDATPTTWGGAQVWIPAFAEMTTMVSLRNIE